MLSESVFDAFTRSYDARRETDMSITEYLDLCKKEPLAYANATERLLAAIGEPQMVDTAGDTRLGRIFMNRTIRIYPAFAGFHGMEETIERIVSFFRHAAQGLEERKQILYLLGPVGGGKSSLAERLKLLMEVHPIYVLKAGDEISPVFESPLNLFDPDTMGSLLREQYGIPLRRLNGLMSPWCLKRLDDFGGDISRFRVVRVQPSRLRQIAIAKTEPETRTIKISRPWSARSISASWRPIPRTIPMPTAIRAGSTAPIRACSNSSRCSRRRSRCCIRC